jgi:DNA-binding NtrC family response regulator
MLGSRRVILLVEDDAVLREATTRQLKARGYAVVPLANARDAAEVLTFMRPAVIIVDYRLPDTVATALLDGDISAASVTAPIVMISGFTEAEAAAAERGIPFVKKPFEIDTLFAAFEPLMTGSQPP